MTLATFSAFALTRTSSTVSVTALVLFAARSRPLRFWSTVSLSADVSLSPLLTFMHLTFFTEAGVAITTGASGSVSATPTVTGIVRTVLSTIVSGDSTIVSAVSTISAAASETEDEETVSTYTSVFTNSDGDVVTTTGETTIGAAGAQVTTFTSDGTEIVRTLETETETASDDEDENVTTYTSGGTKIVSTLVTKTTTNDEEADVTTFTSDGTEIVRTLTTQTVRTGSATETVTDASTATETEDSTETGETGDSSETGTATGTGEASETTSTGNAVRIPISLLQYQSLTKSQAVPQMTAAPVGILAAAGVAMLLL